MRVVEWLPWSQISGKGLLKAIVAVIWFSKMFENITRYKKIIKNFRFSNL